jgi:hypothetical protein
MIDAYAIGVRLTLSDEISAGLKTVHRELATLDRAVTITGRGLKALRQLSIRVGPQRQADKTVRVVGRPRHAQPNAPTAARTAAPPAAKGEESKAPSRLGAPGAGLSSDALTAIARRVSARPSMVAPPLSAPPRAAFLSPAAPPSGRRAGAKPRQRSALAKSPRLTSVTTAPNAPRTGIVTSSANAATGVNQLRHMSRNRHGARRTAYKTGPRSTGVASTTGASGHTPLPTTVPQPAAGVTHAEAALSALARRLLARKPFLVDGPARSGSRANPHRLPVPGVRTATTRRRSASQGNIPATAPFTREPPWRPKPSPTSHLLKQRPALHLVGAAERSGSSGANRAVAPARQPRAPGLAPTSAAMPPPSHQALAVGGRHPEPALTHHSESGEIILDGARFGRLVADRLARLLDRPHSGYTGMDPRATPTWPGAAVD